MEENAKANADSKFGTPTTAVDPNTVKASLADETGKAVENAKANAESKFGTPTTAVDPNTVKASLEAETAKAVEDAKSKAEDVSRPVDPNTVKASLAEEAAKAAEDAKAEADKEAVKADSVRAEAARVEAARVEAARVEAARVEAARVEAERSTSISRAIDERVKIETQNANEKLPDAARGSTVGIDRVDLNPVTANMTIKRAAEGIPKLDEKTGYPAMDGKRLNDGHLTDPKSPYGSKLRTSVVAALSHAFGDDFMSMIQGKNMMVAYMSEKFKEFRAPPTANVPKLNALDDAAGRDEPNKNKLSSAYDAVVENKAFKVTTEILGSIGDVMDVLGVIMLFTDAFYMREEFLTYGQDTSKGYQPRLLTADAVQDAIAKSVDAQVRAIEEYNCMLKKLNGATPPPYQAYTYATYPQISGPLDYLDRELPKKTAYDTQARVLTEINAVREALLKDTNTVHGAMMRDRLGQSSYDSIQAGSNKLWMYVGGLYGQFTPPEADALYRDAFTHVCKYNGGIVYEDTHLGQDITKTDDPNMKGRARFQCGWATKTECINRSNVWIVNKGQAGGNYAEWYTWDELKGFKENPPTTPRSCDDPYGQIYQNEYDYSAAKESKIPAANLAKLQASNSAGACVVASSGIRQMCDQARGNYDPASHTCSFTQGFCQSIGTCYNKATKTCYMPTTALKALNIFFGDGLPREYIRQNGCNFENASNPADIMGSEISSANGQTWNDNAAKDPNLNENFRKLLSSPAYAAGFATSVTGIGQLAVGMSTAGQAAMSKALVTYGTRTTIVQGVATTAPRVLLTSGGVVAGIQILAIGACILAEFMKGWEVINKQPSDEIGEYTVGGWETDGVTPKTLAFTPGWVTKPLPLHAPTDRTLTPLQDLDSSTGVIPGLFTCRFFADQISLGLAGAGDLIPGLPRASGSALEVAVSGYTSSPINSKPDKVPKVQCHRACGTSQGSMKYGSVPATKGILAASEPNADRIWCLPPFPGDVYFDPAIGPKATVIDPGSYTNNTWTNGAQATWPQYPFGEAGKYTEGAWHTPGNQNKNIKQWNYQLVYDKQKFGNADSNVYGTPDHLWNTTLLRKYFRDSNISEMRRYYCQAAMATYIKDNTKKINDKCFGYLSFELENFTFLPMTVLARVGRFTPVV